MKDRNGNGLTFTYSTTRKIINGKSIYSSSPQLIRPLVVNYRLEKIEDDIGHQVDFNYLESGDEVKIGRINTIANTFQGTEVRRTSFEYDTTYGNLTRVKRKLNALQDNGYQFSYDDEYNLTSVRRYYRDGATHHTAHILTNSYDSAGKCDDQVFYSQGVAYQGDQVDYTYAPARVIVTSPNGARRITDYDSGKRPVFIRYDMGTPDDPWDDIVKEIEYSEFQPGCPVCKNRVAAMTAPHYPDEPGVQTKYTYTNDGKVETRTFYQYDWLDRITQITYPTVNGLTLSETIQYDVMGNLHKVTDGRKNITQHWCPCPKI